MIKITSFFQKALAILFTMHYNLKHINSDFIQNYYMCLRRKTGWLNGAVKDANGSIVYLDKSTKHMYELNNKVRLIDVSGFPVKNADEFVGFICGILSQDHDLEQVYLDSFLTTAKLEGKDATETLDQLSAIGETFKVSFIISMSLDKEEVPEAYQDKIICAL